MRSFDYTIKDQLGIHARPAGVLAKESQRYESKITIVKEGKEADTRRLFGMLALGVKSGETITVRIEGADEEVAATEMEEFFKNNL